MSSVCDREATSADSDCSSVSPAGNKGKTLLSSQRTHTHAHTLAFIRLLILCETEEVLVPALPEAACVERGYITPQQAYNLLNAEEAQPALFDPYYILILDCRSADRWPPLQRPFRQSDASALQRVCVCVCVCVRYKESHVVTARAAATVVHPELGCLIGSLELQKFSIILLYAEVGSSPGQQRRRGPAAGPSLGPARQRAAARCCSAA